jgi:hypothetical protein
MRFLPGSSASLGIVGFCRRRLLVDQAASRLSWRRIAKLTEKPGLIGHAFGGLVTKVIAAGGWPRCQWPSDPAPFRETGLTRRGADLAHSRPSAVRVRDHRRAARFGSQGVWDGGSRAPRQRGSAISPPIRAWHGFGGYRLSAGVTRRGRGRPTPCRTTGCQSRSALSKALGGARQSAGRSRWTPRLLGITGKAEISRASTGVGAAMEQGPCRKRRRLADRGPDQRPDDDIAGVVHTGVHA